MEIPNQLNAAYGGIPSASFTQPLGGNNHHFNHCACHCHCHCCQRTYWPCQNWPTNNFPFGGLGVSGGATAPTFNNGLNPTTNASNTNVPTGNN